MTPLATARRLRRHGKLATACTAGAALVGVAAASMAFSVGQHGSAAASPSSSTDQVPAEQADGPTFALPLPELGDLIADLAPLVDPPSVSDPAVPITPLPVLRPPFGPDSADPAAAPTPSAPTIPAPAPILGDGAQPATPAPVIPRSVTDALPPAVQRPVERLLDRLPPAPVPAPLPTVVDQIVEPVDELAGELACATPTGTDPLAAVVPTSLTPPLLEACDRQEPTGTSAPEPRSGIAAPTLDPEPAPVPSDTTSPLAPVTGLLGR